MDFLRYVRVFAEAEERTHEGKWGDGNLKRMCE